MRSLPVLTVAVLLAACGDGGGDDYERAVRDYFDEEEPATEAYEREAEEAADLAGFAAVLADGLEGSRERFREFRADADPPADAEDVHADLVETIREELRLGRRIVAAARAGDEAAVLALEAEVEEVVEEFDELERRFADAGYDVELPDP